MLKKQKKTREEKSAENFFRVDERDVGYATEKEIKKGIQKEDLLKKALEIPVRAPTPKEEILKKSIEKISKRIDRRELETIEKKGTKKVEKKATRKNISRKKVGKKTANKKTVAKKTEFILPKIELKKNGYELIITEKPQAAMKISSALGKSKKRDFKGIPYYEVDREGNKIIVACAVGHLFTLTQKTSGAIVPTFDIDWVPNYMVRKKDFTKKYLDTLSKLAKEAGSVTVATDFDVEGEVIGWNVVRFVCGQKNANRMKFSTLTTKELNKAYDEKLPHMKWGQAYAGETRHHLDWFYGINLSRALMNAIKTTGKFKIMSIGRVQGPALNLIVKREKEIQKFKPEPYSQIFITVDDDKNKLELKHNKDIFDKTDLGKFENLVGKTATAQTKKSEQIIPPNPPFNLTTLQTEAYKFYGITPANTLKAAQSLYLTGLISYPRTSSQKLPSEIGYKEILKRLSEIYGVENLITKTKPIEGKKTDPAHPSIYPTGQTGILAGNEEKIFNLVVKRFLSLFCDDAIVDNKTVKAEVENLIFSTRGMEIRKKAWMEIYPTKQKEVQIPDMQGKVKILDLKIEEKETQPPRRYSPASILSELEKRNLGTKATRSAILETLYERGYVKEKSIEATALGISLIETLEKYSPIIIDEELTRNFEVEMESITNSKSESLEDFKSKEDKITEKAKKTISEIAKHFEEHEKKIGKELVEANVKLQEEQKIENTLNECPKCHKGHLAITYSKQFRRNFIACNAYPECKTTYSLPPNGAIKKTDKVCESCGFPKLMTLRAGKRPWLFCFNKDCETNKERLEEYYRKKEEEKGSQE